MSQKIYKGDEIQLFINDNTLAYATSHTLTITGNTVDIASKDHGEWGASSVGNISWEVTGEYFYTDYSYDTLFDLTLYKRPILVKIAKVANYSPNGLVDLGGDVDHWIPAMICQQGYAVITSLTASANTGEKATYSITLTGTGPLVKVDNTITPYFTDITYSNLSAGMSLFNINGANINSGWVHDGLSSNSIQLDISGGTLKSDDLEAIDDNIGEENAIFRFYFSESVVPTRLFQNISTIDTVNIGSEIHTIQQYAFAGSSITSLTTNVSGMRYMPSCFNGCEYLTSINPSQGFNYLNASDIQGSAFAGCVRLGDIKTGDACGTILNYAFRGCAAMEVIHFGDSLYAVGDDAFSVDSQSASKSFHFYTETAPNIGTMPFGPLSYQTFYLHNCASRFDFISGKDSWRQYEMAEFIVVS